MSEAKRLHPITVVISLIRKIREFLFPIILLLFLRMKGENSSLILLSVTIGLLLAILAFSFVSWYRFTYHLEDAELRIEHGILIRKKRYIPFERIQSIDLSEGILQRLFGLVKVKIETAGGDPGEQAEAVLTAISKQEAQYIQEVFIAAKNKQEFQQPIHQEYASPVYRIHTGQLLLLSLTSGGVGVVVSAVFAFLTQLDDIFSFSRHLSEVGKWAANRMVTVSLLIFAGFVLSWLVAFISMLLRYANFTLSRTEKDLIVSQGLVERRQITLPLKRIQAIRISENIPRQLLGYAAVYVESAGGSSENKEGAKITILPMIKLHQIPSVLEPFLSDYQFSLAVRPLPKAALKRYMIRSWMIPVPIVIGSLILFKAWGLFSLVLLAAVTFWSFLRYKDAGWRIEQKQLTFRSRLFVRETIFMKKNKIQAFEIRESFFQRKKELATVEAHLKSGLAGFGGQLNDVSQHDSEEIQRWYSNR